MRIDTTKATSIEVNFGRGVFVSWPAVFKKTGWSLWDRRPVRQGARHLSDHSSFKRAEKAALELLERGMYDRHG